MLEESSVCLSYHCKYVPQVWKFLILSDSSLPWVRLSWIKRLQQLERDSVIAAFTFACANESLEDYLSFSVMIQ